MCEISAEEVRSRLDYNPETGVFRWKANPKAPKRWDTRYAGTVAGNVKKTGYVQIMLGLGNNFAAHRLAWIWVYGLNPAEPVDHIDGMRSNNRIANLRLAPDGANSINKAMQRNNTSGFVGVTFHPQSGKWRARVTRSGTHYAAGLHDTPEQAAAARDKLAANIHGEFAVSNAADRPKFPHHRDLRLPSD